MLHSQLKNTASRRDDSRHWPVALPRMPARNTLLDLLMLMGADDTTGAAEVPVTMRRVNLGEALFHQGSRADAIYFVLAGTFKTLHSSDDGYEQVLDFPGRTDVLGLEALCSGVHTMAAVALEESSVYVLAIHDVPALSRRLPAFDETIRQALCRALADRIEHVSSMAAVAAEVRLARFLVRLSARMANAGHSARRFRLRMVRRDIASHLGLSHETVSRSFGVLAKLGLLEVELREVCLLDGDGLKAFARSTRRSGEDAGTARPHARLAAAA